MYNSMYNSDSDDDLAPGGTYCRSYCRYAMSEAFHTFFGLEFTTRRYHELYLQRIIMDYVNKHHGVTINEEGSMEINYDAALWQLFGIGNTKCNTQFHLRHLHHHLSRLQRNVGPCPVCEKPRPFRSYCPNEVCAACVAPYVVTLPSEDGVKTDDLVQKILADMYRPITRLEPSEFTVRGITCKRTYDNHFVAIVHCPLCHVEVNEERHLGAFCESCARSEELLDGNGNRVRFKTSTYYEHDELMYANDKEEGFPALHYENGTIAMRYHQGELPCFFRGIPCIAEDTGANNRIVVRFLTKSTKQWDPTADHIRIPAFDKAATQEHANAATLTADWVYAVF